MNILEIIGIGAVAVIIFVFLFTVYIMLSWLEFSLCCKKLLSTDDLILGIYNCPKCNKQLKHNEIVNFWGK